MKCDNLFSKQVKGVVMDMSPARPIGNLLVGIFEEDNVVDNFATCINSLKCYIDDDIGMWDHDPTHSLTKPIG
jgi:hypothetical protein